MKQQAWDRFANKFNIDSKGCWIWTGAKMYSGYGRFSFLGKNVLAHRFAYEHTKGTISEGLSLDHLCRNRACVNPSHLEPVSQKENISRGLSGKYNSDKLFCPKGHRYDSENTYIYPQGRRACKICIRESGRKHDRTKRKRRKA